MLRLQLDDSGQLHFSCRDCGHVFAPRFPVCPYCCPHETLVLTETRIGSDDRADRGIGLGVACDWCLRDFPYDWVIEHCQIVRKPGSSPVAESPLE
jgi:hypothetical protein